MWSFMEENQNPSSIGLKLLLDQNDSKSVIYTKELLQIELYNISSYFDRLSFVLHDHEDITHLPQVKITFIELLNSLKKDLFETMNIQNNISVLEDKASQIIKEINDSLKFLELYLKLQNDQTLLQTNFISILNNLFRGLFNLHQKLKAFSQLEVQPPRFTFATPQQNINDIFLYGIEENIVIKNKNIHDATISLISEKKESLYDKNLKKGHFFLLNKNYALARDFFLKAKNYKQTAEVYTLLGHLASKDNRLDEAREYCLKAIKTDPQFGAAYNDYGVYLLNEGNARDALKWFSLAKKSLYYQNKEFSYINSGRAYFSLGEYERALDEFTQALTLNPENIELHGMVNKIRNNLETKELKEFINIFRNSQENFEINQ